MKHHTRPTILPALLAALLFLLPALTARAQDGTDTGKAVYRGNASAYYAPGDPSVKTSHGVYIPRAFLFTGLSLEYMYLNNDFTAGVQAKTWFPPARKVQGFFSLETGAYFRSAREKDTGTVPESTSWFITPEIGAAFNFTGITLELSFRTRLSPAVTFASGLWVPYPAVGLGISF